MTQNLIEPIQNAPLSVTAVGVMAIFAFLLVREFLNFVDRRKNGAPASHIKGLVEATHDLTKELHTWHDVKDDDGVHVWYVRRSLVDAISTLTEVLDQQMRLLEKQSESLATQTKILTALERRVGGKPYPFRNPGA
jgi:hypothetical protein